MTHALAARRYARDVARGRIPSCKWVKLAAERHLRDLRLQRDPEFPFYFDARAANKVCRFGELFPHVKGQWARRLELLVLGAWQAFILCALFGWKRKKDGRRRFREGYCEIPRKNGKSVGIGAVVALYAFMADDEPGAEVYSGATTEAQAWEVYRPARQMLQKSPDLIEETGAEIWAKTMVLKDGSRFQPVIGKPGDGASPSCAIVDEFHEHDTSDLVDTMVTGMGAREQPLLLQITTAGYNLAGPCYDKHLEARKVLEGVIDNPELFAVMYGIDDEDDWAAPAALVKANPNMGVSVDKDFLLSQQRQAVLNSAYQTRFLTKHLNRWCSASVAWMPLHAWDLCADQALKIEEFAGQPGYVALDLASKLDVCARMRLFWRDLNGQRHYYAFGAYYLPEKTIEENKANQGAYRRWVREGRLFQIEGEEVDFDVVGQDVIADSKLFQVREVVYDPWRATHLAHQLTKEGAQCVEFSQNRHALISQALDEVLAAVKSGRFHHDGDPVLKWMVSNVVLKLRNGMAIPTKDKDDQKIDGVIALVMAVARAMTAEPKGNLEAWLNDPVMA